MDITVKVSGYIPVNITVGCVAMPGCNSVDITVCISCITIFGDITIDMFVFSSHYLVISSPIL